MCTHIYIYTNIYIWYTRAHIYTYKYTHTQDITRYHQDDMNPMISYPWLPSSGPLAIKHGLLELEDSPFSSMIVPSKCI